MAWPQESLAIPPPDMIVSLLQSALQVGGMMVAVVISAMYFLRDWLRSVWHQYRLLSVIFLVGILSLLGLLFLQLKSGVSTPNIPAPVLSNNWLSIEQVIEQEPQDWYRDWKLNILSELKSNIEKHRAKQGQSNLVYEPRPSFHPATLWEKLEETQDEVLFIDTRELNETTQYGFEGSMNVRYGDLVNGIDPEIPRDKILVLVCHSGIRGYLATQMLHEMGYDKAHFMQGGLDAWLRSGFPVKGDSESFKFLDEVYAPVNQGLLTDPEIIKVNFSFTDVAPGYPGEKKILFENMTTLELEATLKSLKTEKVVLVCGSESECFDALNFGYLFTEAGGEVLGYYEFQ